MIRRTTTVAMLLLALGSPATQAEVPPAAVTVREEALRAQNDPTGRPLPLLGHWHRSSFGLKLQVELIKQGIPILPFLAFDRAGAFSSDDLAALPTLREWNMPLMVLHGGQWESNFYGLADWWSLPLEQTGLADDIDGQKIKTVSPLSPIEPWRKLGREWTENANAKTLQTAYPDPPLILFTSNNEALRLRWHKAETSKTYLDAYGLGRSAEFRRQIFGDGWIARYGAMFEGMREGLVSQTWRNNIRFVGYNAFGPDHWSRWDYWKDYSNSTEERIAPEWYVWNGASVEAYDNDWEPDKTVDRVWSMQTEMMNLVFQREEALKVQPNFWFELIFWDGDQPDPAKADKPAYYLSRGINYNPQFYAGWVQYSMWLLVPRVAREFRHASDMRDRWWPYYEQVIAAVQRVHTDPVLRDFWRKGELVRNPARSHPFTRAMMPAKYADSAAYPRWFNLTTSADNTALPDYIWPGEQYKLQIPVWTLARVIGTKPNRQWLVYSHSPLGEKTGVKVTIPDYADITVPTINVEGSFYHVDEASGKVTLVGQGPTSNKPFPPQDVQVN